PVIEEACGFGLVVHGGGVPSLSAAKGLRPSLRWAWFLGRAENLSPLIGRLPLYCPPRTAVPLRVAFASLEAAPRRDIGRKGIWSIDGHGGCRVGTIGSPSRPGRARAPAPKRALARSG